MSRDAGDPPRPRSNRPKPPVAPSRSIPSDEIDPTRSTFQPATGDGPTGEEIHPTRARVGTGGGSRRRPGEERITIDRGGPSLLERLLFGRISSGQLASFCRQLASYLVAGVDLLKTFNSLSKQFAGTALGPVIDRVETSIRRGSNLAEAMAREPQAFDNLFLSMIRAAEARGAVPETLRLMAKHYESRQTLVRQARSAMIYPIIVLVVTFAVCMLITNFVLPGLLSLIEGKGPMPAPTRILIGITHFVQAMGWWAIPAGLVAGGFALRWAYKTPAGKSVLDEIALRLPGLGKLFRAIDTARFARTLGGLLNAGVDYGQAIDLTAAVLHLAPLKRAVGGLREQVMEGAPMSEGLAASRRFDVEVVSVVESGEETGTMPEALDRLADEYEERVKYMVKNLGQVVQPLLMLIIGGIVFFVALAFFMAYASVISGLAGGGI